MPPIRRNTRLNTPQRRPKIAGALGRPEADATSAPVESKPVESKPVEVTEVETTATEADAAAVDRSPAVDDAPVAREGRLGWRLVAVLGGVAVVAAAFAVVAAFRPGAQASNTAYVDIATTSEVTDATRSALNTLYAYAPDSIDQYPDRARGVLTENMRAEFDKTVDPTVSAVKQSGTSTTVELSDVGVKVLDGDRAELIVNMTVSAEAKGVAQDSASGPLIVRMEKVDDVWLLSDIADQ
ncbi:Mce-associated membrane protein [Rhodococcus sp. LBL1]|nr:Mce-associated membrane protein [Rhodococcus sp. LBL1]MDH6686252.1 Mce-associated membrane protein [Rhodococcus sp. LBL2]